MLTRSPRHRDEASWPEASWPEADEGLLINRR